VGEACKRLPAMFIAGYHVTLNDGLESLNLFELFKLFISNNLLIIKFNNL